MGPWCFCRMDSQPACLPATVGLRLRLRPGLTPWVTRQRRGRWRGFSRWEATWKSGGRRYCRGFGKVRCDAYGSTSLWMICTIRGQNVWPHVDVVVFACQSKAPPGLSESLCHFNLFLSVFVNNHRKKNVYLTLLHVSTLLTFKTALFFFSFFFNYYTSSHEVSMLCSSAAHYKCLHFWS